MTGHGTFFDADLVSGCGVANLIAEPQTVVQVLELFGSGNKDGGKWWSYAGVFPSLLKLQLTPALHVHYKKDAAAARRSSQPHCLGQYLQSLKMLEGTAAWRDSPNNGEY